MSDSNNQPRRYSADVRIILHLDGRDLPIGQLGPDFIIMDDEDTHLPPTNAEISLSIDGNVERWPVYLPEGISPERPLTSTTAPRGSNSALAG